MRTLRVYGLAREPMSFIRMSLYHTGGFESSPELRQRFALEPGVLLHPEAVARGGGGEGGEMGEGIVAGAHGLGGGVFSSPGAGGGLGVGADEQRGPGGGRGRAQPRMALRRA